MTMFYAIASITLSILLPIVGLILEEEFLYALLFINFVTFHLIWANQWLAHRKLNQVEFSACRIPLLVFIIFGNLAILI